MFCKRKNAYIKDDLNALRILMNVLCIYLGEGRRGGGGGTNACSNICVGTQLAFTTEPLNKCLRNLVGMKCVWPRTCIKLFWPNPRILCEAKIGHGGPFLQQTSSSDWKATATNRMHSNDLEACDMKCCFFFGFIPKSNF